jgi:hypothetical protein
VIAIAAPATPPVNHDRRGGARRRGCRHLRPADAADNTPGNTLTIRGGNPLYRVTAGHPRLGDRAPRRELLQSAIAAAEKGIFNDLEK